MNSSQESIIECSPYGEGCIHELVEFWEYLYKLSPSKKTHYDRLDEWSDSVSNFVHDKLKKHKFINGGALMGVTQPLKALFWWKINGLVSSVIYSHNLKTQVATHHSSAYERNEALIADLKELMLYYIENKQKNHDS